MVVCLCGWDGQMEEEGMNSGGKHQTWELVFLQAMQMQAPADT